ncbi:MAG TPA: hypothetical protein VFT62_03970 [Mycobacteriales bacterium]|nr:hypothetical protein [Mycobacteriales bacterium]
MTSLQGTGSRAAWGWCVAYTAFAAAPDRARRRGELLSHLWESEQVGIRQRSLLGAAVRGAGSDLTWVLTQRIRQARQGMQTSTPYVVLAALSVLFGAFSNSFLGEPTWIGRVQSGGLLTAVGLLALALVLHLRARHRR